MPSAPTSGRWLSAGRQGSRENFLALFVGHELVRESPEQFDIIQSIDWSTIVIIGGVGSLHGAVLGAAFLITMPQGISIAKGWLPARSSARRPGCSGSCSG